MKKLNKPPLFINEGVSSIEGSRIEGFLCIPRNVGSYWPELDWLLEYLTTDEKIGWQQLFPTWTESVELSFNFASLESTHGCHSWCRVCWLMRVVIESHNRCCHGVRSEGIRHWAGVLKTTKFAFQQIVNRIYYSAKVCLWKQLLMESPEGPT